jgi:hypothetical protein
LRLCSLNFVSFSRSAFLSEAFWLAGIQFFINPFPNLLYSRSSLSAINQPTRVNCFFMFCATSLLNNLLISLLLPFYLLLHLLVKYPCSGTCANLSAVFSPFVEMAGFLGRMMGNQLTKMMPGMAKMQEAMAKIAVSGSAEGSLG